VQWYRFEEQGLIERLKGIIERSGYHWKEGKREDLESIAEDILFKIKTYGFLLFS